MYEVYLDDMMFPIAPQKIQIKINGQNETTTLINGEEINILKAPGLREISFDVILPHTRYPFSSRGSGYDSIDEFLNRLEEMKEGREIFPFIVIRSSPGAYHDTNILVSLEDYKITDDVKEGFDTLVSISLKEYRPYSTKKVNFSIQPEKSEVIVVDAARHTAGAPDEGSGSYTVEKGDCLWSIAKKRLGDGSRYPEIYELNKNQISNPNLIYPGQVLTMP